jgi:NitT/TauT family transport system substrate-binding protein
MSVRVVRVLLWAAASLGTFGWQSSAQALEPLTVQLAFYPQGPQAYLFLAKDKGWFDKAGLAVELLDGRGSNYSMQVVSSGHADIGEGQLTPMASAREKGARVKAIAEWFKKDGPALVVPQESAINSPADLKGKKAVLIAAGPWPPLLDSFLKQFGMTQSDLTLMYVDSTALFSTYATGAADAMLTVDLAFSEANPRRASRLMSAVDYGVKLPGDGLYVTEDTLAQKQATLTKFIAVCIAALDYIYDGHEAEAVDAIKAQRPELKLTPETLRFQVDMYRPLRFSPATEGHPVGWQSGEDWKERIAFMTQIGLLKAGYDSGDFFTNAFIDASAK